MTVHINYNKKINFKNLINHIVLFTNENFDIFNLKKFILNKEYLYVKENLKTCDLKKNIHSFDINSKKKNNSNFN